MDSDQKQSIDNFVKFTDSIVKDITQCLMGYMQKDPKLTFLTVFGSPLSFVFSYLEESIEKGGLPKSLLKEIDLPGVYIRAGKAFEGVKHLWPPEDFSEFEKKFHEEYERVQREHLAFNESPEELVEFRNYIVEKNKGRRNKNE